MQPLENVINIHNYLPHRAPMLMVDYILEMNEMEVVTLFTIKSDNCFIENSFFSEIGLIENAAQTCSSIVAKSYFFDENNKERENVKVVGFISGIKQLHIHKLPKVGVSIKTQASLISRFDTDAYKISSMKCVTYHQSEVIFEAEMNLFIQKIEE